MGWEELKKLRNAIIEGGDAGEFTALATAIKQSELHPECGLVTGSSKDGQKMVRIRTRDATGEYLKQQQAELLVIT